MKNCKKIISIVLLFAILFAQIPVLADDTTVINKEYILQTYFSEVQVGSYKTIENTGAPYSMTGEYAPAFTSQKTVDGVTYGLNIYADGSYFTTQMSIKDVIHTRANITYDTITVRWDLEYDAYMEMDVRRSINELTGEISFINVSNGACAHGMTTILGTNICAVTIMGSSLINSKDARRYYEFRTFDTIVGDYDQTYELFGRIIVNSNNSITIYQGGYLV